MEALSQFIFVYVWGLRGDFSGSLPIAAPYVFGSANGGAGDRLAAG
jgi:hypothetical protein